MRRPGQLVRTGASTATAVKGGLYLNRLAAPALLEGVNLAPCPPVAPSDPV